MQIDSHNHRGDSPRNNSHNLVWAFSDLAFEFMCLFLLLKYLDIDTDLFLEVNWFKEFDRCTNEFIILLPQLFAHEPESYHSVGYSFFEQSLFCKAIIKVYRVLIPYYLREVLHYAISDQLTRF